MGKGLDFDQLYPGRFLKAGDLLGRSVTLQIANIKTEDLEGEDRKKKPKAIFAFEPTAAGRPPPKDLVACKTNGICMREMFGRDSGDWIGKRVTFHPEMVDSFGAKELAIRVCGSPDIPADITFTLKLHGKSPRQVTLKKTAVRGATPARASAPAPSSPTSPEAASLPPEPPVDELLPGQAGYISPEEPPPLSDADAPPVGGAA